jgi:EmrB/QacA subfamily drug resistance transporter
MTKRMDPKWWALGALVIGILAVGLDATIINIALPTLASQLHASTGQLQWIADAYNLVFAAMLLPAGLLGDRYGRKRMLMIALVLFGLASAACAFAPTAEWLIAARALLGIGGAFLIPLSMAVLPILFTEEERPKAMSAWLVANAVSFPIGPIFGGWLLSHFWWGAAFLINVPVVLLALLAVGGLLPETRNPEQPSLDWPGIVMSSLGLAGVIDGLIEAGDKGWGDPLTLGPLVVGSTGLAAFVAWQRHLTARPGGQSLVDLSLFRSASFTWGTLLSTISQFAMFGVLFTLPQFFQAVGGADSMGAGLRILPIIGGLVVGAKVAERLGTRVGAKATVALGYTVLAAGLFVGATTGLGSGEAFTLSWIAVIGVGLGFAMPSTMNAALSALSPERSGVGSGLNQALRQVGGAVGVAVLGTVMGSVYRDHLDLTGLPAPAAEIVRKSVFGGVAIAQRLHAAPLLASVRGAFVHGMDAMLGVCGGLMVVGIALAIAFLPGRASTATAQGKRGLAEHAVIG